MPTRFRTRDETLDDFGGEALVVCPRCSGLALVRAGAAGPGARLSCAHCGLSSEWEPSAPGVLRTSGDASRFPGHVAYGGPCDPYFRLPLWLQAPCRGERLWAYNEAHLAWLEGFVGATLRERSPGPQGWSNRGLASRLPRWMASGRGRDEVLRCLRGLRDKLPG